MERPRRSGSVCSPEISTTSTSRVLDHAFAAARSSGSPATPRGASSGSTQEAEKPSALVVEMLAAWERWYRRWERGEAVVSETYAEYSSTLGQAVRAHLPDGGQIEGLASGISDSGGLVIDVDGREREVAAADVVHLRPAPP